MKVLDFTQFMYNLIGLLLINHVLIYVYKDNKFLDFPKPSKSLF